MKPLLRISLTVVCAAAFLCAVPSVFAQSDAPKGAKAVKQGKHGGVGKNKGRANRTASKKEKAENVSSGNAEAAADAEPVKALEAEEGAEPTESLTPEELAELADGRKRGTVPDFASEGGEAYNAESEEAFYNESIRTRRDDDAFPSTSLVLRRYADSVIDKYDFNKDGLLQESEWSKIPGAPQAIDMNGDFVLTGDEILYYLARYARGRTIFRPTPPISEDRRHMLRLSDRSVLIRPLSGPLRTETAEEAEDAKKNEGLADLTENDLSAIIEETDKAVGTEDDPELFGLLVEEMDESKQREYAAPLEQIRGMPIWFLARDLNGDGQLSLREFAPGLSLEATAFFGRLDADSDGFVTPDEVKKYMNDGSAKEEKTDAASPAAPQDTDSP